MLTSFRALATISYGVNFIKRTPSHTIYQHILEQHYIKHLALLKCYHTITQSQKNSEFSLPREDYTLNQDVAKANWTISKLFKVGNVSEARKVFNEMPERDVISWTGLISGYINCGLIEQARELFDRIDAKKNVVTWTAMISGYLRKNRVFDAERLFYEMPDKNVVAWNTMLDGYIRVDMIEKALMLFDTMENRNVVSWNMVISGLLNCGRVEEAKGLFGKMPIRDVISWTIMISGLARNRRVDEARFLFDSMPETNVVSWNAMISGYVRNSRLSEAYGLFEAMPKKNVKSWNIMLSGFIQSGEVAIANRLFNEMSCKNVVSWTTMISGCTRCGESELALKTFFVMSKDRKVIPNEGTFVSVLGACSDLAGLGEGMQIHQVISKTIYLESQFVISSLINMYSKCGELEMAIRMFNDVSRNERDLVLWNSMIVAYAHHGCVREAIMVFDEMQNTGLKPNETTYLGLLLACSYTGLVDEALNYFNVLLRDESVKVREDHYTCVVDLYGRAGRLEEAFDFIQESQLKDSKHAWGALLSGCNVHGNGDLGNIVAKKLMDMDGGLKKQPGCSWIEVGNKFDVFVVGDRSHRESDALRNVLFDLHEKMRNIGYSLLDNFMMEDDFFRKMRC